MLNFSQFQTSSVIGVSAVSTTFDGDDVINDDYGDDVCDDIILAMTVYLAHNVSVNIHDNQTALSSCHIHLRTIRLKTRIVIIIVIMNTTTCWSSGVQAPVAMVESEKKYFED